MIDNDYREVDTDEKNVSDVEETKEGTPVETGEVVTDDSTEDNEKTDDFDEFCAMCRRPASKAGKLIHVAPNMAICQDCMQKTFDTMGQMPGIPGLGDINIGDMLSSGKMPNIQFVNMSDLPFGNQQKVKKKKSKYPRGRVIISAPELGIILEDKENPYNPRNRTGLREKGYVCGCLQPLQTCGSRY